MSKKTKIITITSISIVVALSVVFGCLFGIKCTVTFDYGFNTYYPEPTEGNDRELLLYIIRPIYTPSVKVTRFTKYAPDRPTRKGYTFGGWYTDSACTIPWNNKAVTGDITLYAKWESSSQT